MSGVYDKFDQEILNNISSGFVTANRILGNSYEQFPDYGSGRYRAVDRRLQVLKKKGLISFNHKTGWSINISDSEEVEI